MSVTDIPLGAAVKLRSDFTALLRRAEAATAAATAARTALNNADTTAQAAIDAANQASAAAAASATIAAAAADQATSAAGRATSAADRATAAVASLPLTSGLTFGLADPALGSGIDGQCFLNKTTLALFARSLGTWEIIGYLSPISGGTGGSVSARSDIAALDLGSGSFFFN